MRSGPKRSLGLDASTTSAIRQQDTFRTLQLALELIITNISNARKVTKKYDPLRTQEANGWSVEFNLRISRAVTHRKDLGLLIVLDIT